MSETPARHTADAGRRRRWHAAWWLLVLVALGFAVGVMVREHRCSECETTPNEAASKVLHRLDVDEVCEAQFRALKVTNPAHLRWMDAGDIAYSEAFRSTFSYHQAQVRTEYEFSGGQLRGRIVARGLKPWFAYQLKLVGDHPLLGVREADNDEPGARSSWLIGSAGRWWCEQCHCNVSGADLGEHVARCHQVRGYLLFDWFMTNGAGEADHFFIADSSLHVLWKVEQRQRGPKDTPPRWYRIERRGEAYAATDQGTDAEVGVYGEWEPERARVGHLHLPAGEYSAWLNLTEESWHANMPGRESALGGFWAWVMEADVRFSCSPSPLDLSRAARPGCLLGLSPCAPLIWWRGGS